MSHEFTLVYASFLCHLKRSVILNQLFENNNDLQKEHFAFVCF